MSIHFYAGYWQFGIGVTNFEGEPYCSLLSFDSRKERDAWVAADHFDNNSANSGAFQLVETAPRGLLCVKSSRHW